MEYLVVDEAIDLVSLREAVDFTTFVLQGPPIDAIRNSCVEVQRSARHDVYVISSGLQLQIPLCAFIRGRMNSSLGMTKGNGSD